MKCPFHRVERIFFAGQNAEFHQFMPWLWQFAKIADIQHLPAAIQLANHHVVFGQRAGFVGAQHGGGTQGFDGIQPPCQHIMTGDAPCAQRHEYRQDHREFFRQGGHRQTDPGQQRVQPVPARVTVDQHHGDAQRDGNDRKTAHQSPCLDA